MSSIIRIWSSQFALIGALFGVFLISGCQQQRIPTHPEAVTTDPDPHWVIQQKPRANVALVYVHGITGDIVATWTAANGETFWNLVNNSDQLHVKTDAFVYGYPSFLFQNGSLDIQEAANRLHERLKYSQVMSYPTIVFVAHSMGGLVVLRELLTHHELMDRVPLVMLYATPMEGSVLGLIASKFSPDPGYREMTPADGNALLQILDSEWKAIPLALRPHIRCAYEKLAIAGQKVVSWSSATRLCEEVSSPIEATHITIIKPERPTSDAIVDLVNALNDFVPNIQVKSKPVVVPPPPSAPQFPAQGLWSVTLDCTDTSGVNEPAASFDQGLYARGFRSGTVAGRTELSMGFEGSNRVHLVGFVVFGDSDIYSVDATGNGDNGSFRGSGTFGQSSGCLLTAIQRGDG